MTQLSVVDCICLNLYIYDVWPYSLLIRQLPSYDFSHWYHSALYYKPKEFGKGQWLDDYKYLYYYSIDSDVSLKTNLYVAVDSR